MSQVKEFELLHGIVLTKILRTNGATLKLVETDAKKAWAAYTINNEVIVYIKYSLTNREAQKEGKLVWTFPFQPSELAKLIQLRQAENKGVYAALVCGTPNIEEVKKMQVCLLEPEQIYACMDLNSRTIQSISVEYRSGASLRAYGSKNAEEKKKLTVSRNKLDEWKIPGS